MSSVDYIVLSLVLAFIALTAVSYVNRRQMRARLISQRLAQMRRRVAELEELTIALDLLTDAEVIPRLINDEVIDMLEKMKRLDTSSPYLDINLENAQQRREELNTPGRKRRVFRVQKSDAALARSQYQLNEAGRIIRHQQSQGHLEIAEMESLIRDLSWAHLMVEVTTFIAQGYKARAKGDILRAYAFYKKAQQIAMQASHPDERRHQFIREIGDLMSNRRDKISTVLMPESDEFQFQNATPVTPPTQAQPETFAEIDKISPKSG